MTLIISSTQRKEGFAEPKYGPFYELLATMDDTALPSPGFDPTSIEEILCAQFNNEFCAELRRRLSMGKYYPLSLTIKESLFAQATSGTK